MDAISKFWSALGVAGKVTLVSGVLIILIGMVSTFYWLTKVEQGVLFSNLDEHDAANVVQKLAELDIKHSFQDGGSTILVAKDMVHDTRYSLISNGLHFQNPVGFELFDSVDFGLTEFAQKVNYQRALEGETARTISNLSAVKFARVHLSLPKTGILRTNVEQPKASVAIVLHDGQTITKKQTQGIQRLVASAVQGLDVENVSVIDDKGNSYTVNVAEDMDLGSLDERVKLQLDYENKIRQKLMLLLNQLYPSNSAQVAVDIALNFDKKVQRIKDIKSPSSQAHVLKRRESNSSTGTGKKSKVADTSKESNLEEEYIYGSETTEKEFSIGQIEHLSVAVALTVALTEKEQSSLKRLLSAAIGLQPARGDIIEVESFTRVVTKDTQSLFESAESDSPESSQVIIPEITSIDVPVAQEKEVSLTSKLNAILAMIGSASIYYSLAFIFIVILIISALIWFVSYRQNQRKRLSLQEKDELLAEIKGWLAVANNSDYQVEKY